MYELLRNGSRYLISEKCFDNYFIEHNFLDVECFSALLSKVLGFGIIAGSLLVKVPQVLKIYNNKSAVGISLASVLFDLTAITFHMSYNFVKGYPFSTWGDNVFLALQTAAIAAMILYYGGAVGKSILFSVGYAAITYILCSGLTPLSILLMIQSLTIPILLIGKMSQAWANFQNSSTGQLSAVTVFLMLAGSLARIFTSVQETGDVMMITTFCVSSFANGIIAAQILYYWNAFNEKLQREHRKTSNKYAKVD